jgi:NitT/TauT family transport system ATP-binding protein
MQPMTSTAAAMIRVDQLTKRYAERIVLQDVSFDVAAGEIVSVVGPSGCGKTTLLRSIAGLAPPSSGSVSVAGQEVTGPPAGVAVVFQHFGLFPWKTVFGNVAYGLLVSGMRRRDAEPRVRQLIRLVGLEGFEKSYPYQLSGGMQQRAGLARALAIEPRVLVMDEPFASLDAQTREVMQEELLRIWAQAKKTVLFITHQIDEAIYLSDRVVVFSGRPGKVKETIAVDMERPRPLGVKRQPRFHAIEDRIWGLIEEDVKGRMAGERGPPRS